MIKVEHFAIIFLVVGIVILYFMSEASDPIFVHDYSELGNYEGEIVITKGIIIDYDETSRSETILTVLEPNDLNSTLKVFIESASQAFLIGDLIQVQGSVLRINDDLLELVVINEKDIETIGHWHGYKLSIPKLAHRLEHNPSEFKYLPVEVTGYLKYEPRIPISSLYLTEHPIDGFYNVKVEILDSTQIASELHKGDLVSVNVSIYYNENNFEYKLSMINLTLLESYGNWDISLTELVEAPFVFENAQINVSGYVYNYEPHFNYILIFDLPAERRSMANYSIWVDISGLNLTATVLQDDYYVSIRGVLYYDPQYTDYAIKADEITIN